MFPCGLVSSAGEDDRKHAMGSVADKITKKVAVIGGEHHQRIVGRAGLLEGFQQPAYLRIEIAGHRVAGATHAQDARPLAARLR